MKINKITSVLFLFLVLAAKAYSQVIRNPMKDIPGFRQKLEIMTGELKTIESDFVQEKKLAMLNAPLISKGHFWFKRENNIRWEYKQPYAYLIIISQDKIFIKEEKDQNQYDIQSNKMFQEMNKFISGCIRGDILKNDKEYKISYYEDERFYFVTLVPVSEKMRQMLNEVQIWFDRSDLTVSRVRMMEQGGDYTRIDFNAKRTNTEIPAERFTFR